MHGLDEGDAGGGTREKARSELLRRAGRLGAELFVVFVGVYAAFLLSQYQESRREDARREAIYRALLAETDQTSQIIDEQARVLRDIWIDPIVAPYERGDQPYIYGVWLPSGQLGGTWDALVASAVGSLDPAFIQQVGSHQARVQFMLDQTARALRLSDEHITPATEAQDFYGPDGRLRPQYQWYVVLPRYLLGNTDRARASGDSLRAEILRRLDEAP